MRYVLRVSMMTAVAVAMGSMMAISQGRLQGGQAALDGLTSNAELIAQGLLVSVGATREIRTQGLLPNGVPVPTLRRADLTFQLTEIYKGTAKAGSSVAIIAGIRNDNSRPFEPGQRFLLFLTPASADSVKGAPTLPAETRRYDVTTVTSGIDEVTPGWLEIKDGKTRPVPFQTQFGGMTPYLGLPPEQVVANVLSYVSREGR